MADEISETTSTSAERIGNDVLMDILVSFPEIFLVKWQLVNKHWRYVINSDAFIQYYRSRHPCKPCKLLSIASSYHKFTYLDPVTKDFFRYNSMARLLQSSHGLLLIFDKATYEFYVYNPMTSQFTNLNLVCNENTRDVSRFCLAFDPSKSPHYYVVCARLLKRRFVVYDSTTSLWSEGKDSFTTTISYKFDEFSKGIYFNNRIHWIRAASKTSYWKTNLLFKCIEIETLYLDPETGLFGTCKFGPYWRICTEVDGTTTCKTYVTESNSGRSQIVARCFGPKGPKEKSWLVIYEMSEDDVNRGWSCKSYIELSPIVPTTCN